MQKTLIFAHFYTFFFEENKFEDSFHPSFRNQRASGSEGGGERIRTPETLTSLTVFKTAAFNRSATPPV